MRCVVRHSKIAALMSASGHKRTFREVRAMSALPPKADIDQLRRVSKHPAEAYPF
jgi:hypothetical protein